MVIPTEYSDITSAFLRNPVRIEPQSSQGKSLFESLHTFAMWFLHIPGFSTIKLDPRRKCSPGKSNKSHITLAIAVSPSAFSTFLQKSEDGTYVPAFDAVRGEDEDAPLAVGFEDLDLPFDFFFAPPGIMDILRVLQRFNCKLGVL